MTTELTDHHHAIAKANGFDLYGIYPEKKAAEYLGMHVSKLRRIRRKAQIGFLRASERSTAYFGYHLVNYLLAQETCPDMPLEIDTKSETSGSVSEVEVTPGIVCGVSPALDGPSALASAQRILTKPRHA